MTLQSDTSSTEITFEQRLAAMLAAIDASPPDPLELEKWCRDTAPAGYIFDEARAERGCAFFPRYLVHTTGEWAGLPFYLTKWERAITRCVCGWLRPDRRRRFRRVWLEIARKNGKSTFVAGLLLLMFVGDGEAGAQIYSAAADRDQASIIFNEAKRMANRDLLAELELYKQSMVCLSLGAVFKPISSNALAKHGLNPHAFAVDEVHAQATRELIDVLHTALGARRQPLELYATTAGDDVTSIEFEMHDRAEKVWNRIIEDPELLPVIFAVPLIDDVTGEELDWRNSKYWPLANPSLGISLLLEDLEKECREAIDTPGYENTFRRLKLNQRVGAAARHFTHTQWKNCTGPATWRALEDELEGRECFGGVDLSATQDTTSAPLVFPPADTDRLGEVRELEAQIEARQAEGDHVGAAVIAVEAAALRKDLEPWKIVTKVFLPGDDLPGRSKRDRVPYDVWKRDGALSITDGDEVDQEAVKRWLETAAKRYRLVECAYDRWNALSLVQELTGDGLAMVPMGQGYGSLASPSKYLTTIVKQRKIAHGGHPVLAWQISNLVMKRDDADNIKPSKVKSRGRIDIPVGVVMALGRAIAPRDTLPKMAVPSGYTVAAA